MNLMKFFLYEIDDGPEKTFTHYVSHMILMINDMTFVNCVSSMSLTMGQSALLCELSL